MRAALFGTPYFAIPSLEALHACPDIELVAVVTQCDRPVGRKAIMTPPPIKVRAQELGVPVLQIEKINLEESLEQLRALDCDVFITAAYGQILRQPLLDIPKYGVINVHASLLPKYRGAAPIAWSIKCGETVTGVSTMFTDVGVDTGDILLQSEVAIEDTDTTETLTEKLAKCGAETLIDTLHQLADGTLVRIPQDNEQATRTPMIKKTHGKIDFAMKAREIDCLVRAMTPWPGTWTTMGGKQLKVFGVEKVDGHGTPGTIIDGDFTIACGDGAIRPTEIQLEGSKRMKTQDFLRGRKPAQGTVLGDEQ